MKKILVLLLAVTFGLTACDKGYDSEEQLAIDKEIIEAYLSDNGLTAQTTPSGLYYIIDIEGDGVNPDINSSVVISYTGKLINGDVFDSGTINDNYSYQPYPLTSFIEGWQIGIPLFKVGGKGTLFVPSGLGYGPTGSRSIAPNTVLIFDVNLIGIR